MIHFKQLGLGSPWYLLLLLPLAALTYLDAHRQVFVGLRWPKIFRLWAARHELDLTTPIPTPHVRWRFWTGMTFLTIALAQPRLGYLEVPLQDAPKEIVVALDLSRSMLARDVKPSRLEHAKLLVQAFLDKLAGDRVALVLFSGTAYLQLPLSTDYEIMAGFLPNLSPDYFPQAGTNFEAMISTSLEAFTSDPGVERFLVVLSDGEVFDDKWHPLVDQLSRRGVHVLTLGVGTTGGGVMPLSEGGLVKDSAGNEAITRLNPATLQDLAKATGGTYTPAESWVNVADVLSHAATAGEKKLGMKTDNTRLAERFQWFLVPAILFLGLSFWRELPVRPRARDIKIPPPPPTPPKSPRHSAAAVPAGVALILLALILTITSARAQDMGDLEENNAANARLPMNSLANLVSIRIQDILTKKDAGANDYVSLVIDSVAYMETMLKSRTRFPLSVIDDCYMAISVGEKLDKEGGDWPKLRDDLVRLRQADTEPWKTAAPDAAGKADVSTSFDPDHDMKAGQKSPGNPSQQYDSGMQSTDSTVKKKTIAGSAFGEMTDEKPQVAQSISVPVPPGSQVVGGQKDDLDEEREEHPELALPLQKLEHVRNQDSPAKLFQMLEGNKNYLVPQGPDW